MARCRLCGDHTNRSLGFCVLCQKKRPLAVQNVIHNDEWQARNNQHYAYARDKRLEKEKPRCKKCGLRACVCQSIIEDFVD
jgi:hypothetical protein